MGKVSTDAKLKDKTEAKAGDDKASSYIEERSVQPVYNLNPAGSGASYEWTVPLRLLDSFSLFTTGADDVEQLVGLEQLDGDGNVDGQQVMAKGTLLDHKLAATSLADAKAAGRARVRITGLRDWVADYTEPAALWVISNAAWYRLVAPAPEYAATFRPVARRLQLAARSVAALADDPNLTWDAAVPRLTAPPRSAGSARGPRRNRSASSLAADGRREGEDPYALLLRGQPRAGAADVLASASWLLPQLAPFLGRHAAKSEYLAALADQAGVPLSSCVTAARPLRGRAQSDTPAVLARRPQPHTTFEVDAPLVPGVLTAWDFCQRYRALLRLPPFPLVRLQRAFLPNPQPGSAPAPEQPGGAPGYWAQGPLLRDLHAAMLRLVEGLDEELLEPPTLAGYGAAADLAPQEAYKPLLGVTWPELVRHYLEDHDPLALGRPARGALARLKEVEYEQLSAAEQLALLEALLHVTADSEVLRSYLLDTSLEGSGSDTAGSGHGLSVGQDGHGNRYYQLGGDNHGGRLWSESPDGEWGWYEAQEVPALLAWLETGSSQEQDLADDLYNLMPTVPTPAAEEVPSDNAAALPPCASLELADGYHAARGVASAAEAVRAELAGLLAAVPWGERDQDWLRGRAAVLRLLPHTTTGPQFARLMWVLEGLVYDHLLKGTGWGRRRGWYREQLEECHTLAQAALVAGQLASHCRKSEELGLMPRDDFFAAANRLRYSTGLIPSAPSARLLFRSGYLAHRAAWQRLPQLDSNGRPLPPLTPAAGVLPDDWGPVEECTLTEVAWARVVAPFKVQPPFRQAAQVVGAAEDTRLLVWLLLERPAASLPADAAQPAAGQAGDLFDDSEIDWTSFSFQHGFRPPRPKLEGAEAAAQAGMSADGQAGAPGQAADAKDEAGPAPEGTPGPARVKVDKAGAVDMEVDATDEPGRHSSQLQSEVKQEGVRNTGNSAGAAAMEGQKLRQDADTLPAASNGPAQLPGMSAYGGSDTETQHATGQQAEDVSDTGTAAGSDDDDEEEGVPHRPLTRSRRAGAAPKPSLARYLEELGEDGEDGEGGDGPGLPGGEMELEPERVRYWRHDRRFAAVALHLRPPQDRLPQFLLPITGVLPSCQRLWPAGLPVKIPMTCSLQEALSYPPVKLKMLGWYTGTVVASWAPVRVQLSLEEGAGAASGAGPVRVGLVVQDPWLALAVRWDEDVPTQMPPRVSPWQVTEDPGGHLAAEKARRRAEVRARAEAQARARAEAAMQRAAQQARLAEQAAAARAATQQSLAARSAAHQQQAALQASAALRAAEQQQAVAQARAAAALAGTSLPPAMQHAAALASAALQHHAQMAAQRQAQQMAPGAVGLPASRPAGPAGQPQTLVPSTATANANSAGGVEQVDGKSGRKRAREAGSSKAGESYWERWMAKKPRASPGTWQSCVCAACEQGGQGLAVCQGPCLRAFHAACLPMQEGLRLSAAVAQGQPWFCPECDTGRMRCFACGEVGAGFEDPTVRKCTLGICGRFYHVKCVTALDLTHPAKKGYHFRCPQHYCHVCRKSGDGLDMVKCLRCPTAYHSACLPEGVRRLGHQSKVVLCTKHAPEEEPRGYTMPPGPSAERMAAAQATAREQGLPPMKPAKRLAAPASAAASAASSAPSSPTASASGSPCSSPPASAPSSPRKTAAAACPDPGQPSAASVHTYAQHGGRPPASSIPGGSAAPYSNGHFEGMEDLPPELLRLLQDVSQPLDPALGTSDGGRLPAAAPAVAAAQPAPQAGAAAPVTGNQQSPCAAPAAEQQAATGLPTLLEGGSAASAGGFLAQQQVHAGGLSLEQGAVEER